MQKTQATSLKNLDLIVSSQPGGALGDTPQEGEPNQEDQDGFRGTNSGTTATRSAEHHGRHPAAAPETAPQSKSGPEGTAEFRNTGSQVKRTEQEPGIGSIKKSQST